MQHISCSLIIEIRAFACRGATVDGRNPKQPPGMVKTLYKKWDHHHPLWCRISAINSSLHLSALSLKPLMHSSPNGDQGRPFPSELRRRRYDTPDAPCMEDVTYIYHRFKPKKCRYLNILIYRTWSIWVLIIHSTFS